ncbi:MAG: NADH-quinone oxidoreductase subunit L, partial [Bacteroidota bacterium]
MNYALIPLFPLIGFIIVALFGKRINNEKITGSIASAAVLLSFIMAVMAFNDLRAIPEDAPAAQQSIMAPVYT